jgi:hypothetical protein
VNLNGHHILGPGSGNNDSGIISGNAGLTVKNGTISNFTQDVQVSGSGLVLRHLAITFTPGGYGVHVIASNDADIFNLFVGGIGIGIWLDHDQNSTVSGNYLVNPDRGIWDLGGSSNTLLFNAVNNVVNGQGIVAQGTTGAVMKFNAVIGSSSSIGIYNLNAMRSTITENLLNGLHYGVADQSSHNGTIAFNVGAGDTQGINVTNSTDAVHDNLFI